jgi:hypothetical protein
MSEVPEGVLLRSKAAKSSDLPTYEPPRLTVLNEEEVLQAFQVPVVATTWWVM